MSAHIPMMLSNAWLYALCFLFVRREALFSLHDIVSPVYTKGNIWLHTLYHVYVPRETLGFVHCIPCLYQDECLVPYIVSPVCNKRNRWLRTLCPLFVPRVMLGTIYCVSCLYQEKHCMCMCNVCTDCIFETPV